MEGTANVKAEGRRQALVAGLSGPREIDCSSSRSPSTHSLGDHGKKPMVGGMQEMQDLSSI